MENYGALYLKGQNYINRKKFQSVSEPCKQSPSINKLYKNFYKNLNEFLKGEPNFFFFFFFGGGGGGILIKSFTMYKMAGHV